MRAKRDGIFFKMNCCERSEQKIFGKFCTFPPNSSKLRSDYLFSFQKRTNYLFPAFSRSEYLFPKSASPQAPHPQNQMVVPLALLSTHLISIHSSIYIARSSYSSPQILRKCLQLTRHFLHLCRLSSARSPYIFIARSDSLFCIDLK